MKKIKAAFFDYDGVMTTIKTGTESISGYISENTGVNKDIFEKEYKKYNPDLTLGKITHKEIWKLLCNNIGMDIPINILYDSFIQTPIDNEMYELVAEIKEQNVKTGLITDNKADRIGYIHKKIDLHKYFDVIAVSGELGYGKESKEIFLWALSKAAVKPEESIFIDNQEKNLIIPQELGIKTLCFNDNKRNIHELKNKIREYGIKLC